MPELRPDGEHEKQVGPPRDANLLEANIYGRPNCEQVGGIYEVDTTVVTDTDDAYDTDTNPSTPPSPSPIVWDKSKYKIIPSGNIVSVNAFNSKFFGNEFDGLLGSESWNDKKFYETFLSHATPKNHNTTPKIAVLGGGNDKVVFFRPTHFETRKFLPDMSYDTSKSCYKIWGTYKKFTKPTEAPCKPYDNFSYRLSPRLNDLIHALGQVGHPNLANYSVFAAHTSPPEKPVCFGAKCDFYPGTLGGTYFNVSTRASWQNNPNYWQALRWWLHQLLEAVGFMHSRGIAHRAIEVDTVYIDRDHSVKLGNFNHSIQAIMGGRQPVGRHYVCNHLNYRAPEMCVSRDKRKYDGRLVDDWAVGCVMVGILANLEPFQGKILRGTTRTKRKVGHTHLLNQQEELLQIRSLESGWNDPTENKFAKDNKEMPAPEIDSLVTDFFTKFVKVTANTENRLSDDLLKSYKDIAKGLLKGETEIRWGIFQALNTEYFKKVEKPQAWPPLAQPSAIFNTNGSMASIGIQQPVRLLKFMDAIKKHGFAGPE